MRAARILPVPARRSGWDPCPAAEELSIATYLPSEPLPPEWSNSPPNAPRAHPDIPGDFIDQAGVVLTVELTPDRCSHFAD